MLGSIVLDDVKLGTLFMILIMATPGTVLSIQAQVISFRLERGILLTLLYPQADPSLQKVQADISLLMYRYLKNKLADPDEASRVTNSLLM